MDSYVYRAVAQLNDGTEVSLDLEKRGWADPDLLSRVTRFNLIPMDGAVAMGGRALPIVVANIPADAKPVFRSRVYGVIGSSGEGLPTFRCYGVGFMRRGVTHLTWVLPTGDIETSIGDEIFLADTLLRHTGAQ